MPDTLDSLVAEMEGLLPKVGKGPSEIDARFAEVALGLVPMLLEERKRHQQTIAGTIDPLVGATLRESLRSELIPQLVARAEAAEAKLAEQREMYEVAKENLEDALESRDRYEEAIRWALGEGEDFPFRKDGQSAYWWRTELRKRAALPAPPDGGKE